MSAPSSGSAGPPSAAPVPGYYPDPSIPRYIRYWNGSAWVPGTSRPAPEGAAGAAAGPAAVDESGPMYLDEDPRAPVAQLGGASDGGPAAPPAVTSRTPDAPSGATASGAGAPAWPAPAPARPGTELPPISWGAPALPEQPGPQQRRPVAPAPAPPPAVGPAPWADQVHELAAGGGEAVVPWRPVADDPFGGAAAQERPGGLVRRFAARVIDTVLLAAVTGAAAVPLGTAAYHHMRDKVDQAKLTGRTVKVWLIDGTTGTQLGAVLAVALVASLLLEVLPTARWGRTIGKKLVGLRVLDIEAQLPPGFWASARRWLTRLFLDVLVVGVLGLAWCVFDRPWRQCWHDKAAGTFVARA